ncbi:MAG: DUF4815 domain-containing protein, partial [Nanoarchaeota archaeon]|nr:DUF4815 domain-containing protein [Nanoarchaeota archaeon]
MQKPSTFVANYKPYNESFDIENQIYKVLFKPSCNITSNDLNLLQSILQEQIAKFGQHFFQNGSFVSGGEFLFKDSVITFIGESDSLTISELEGLYFKHETEDLIIKIDISNLISEDSTSQLLSGKTNFVVSVVSGTLLDKESFFSTFENFYLYNQLTGSVNLEKFLKVYDYEYSSYVKINSGIIFIDGYFVNVNQQVRLLNPLQEKPSLSVGFEIKKSIVNYNDDSSLLDNAIGAPSYNSIGADRLKIELKLTLHTIIEDSNYFDITVKDNFIEYLRIKSGVIIKDVHIPVYSEFAKTLARRTYNESGNYTVKPFKIKLSDKDENNYNIEISPGKAYIFGYEMNSISTRNIELPKIKNTTSVANQKIKIPSGSYFIIDSLLTFINTNESEIINFYNS